ncbi:MAG: hypothetical protein DRR16_09900 [Candidatus Parabeggiatoa sp. nov. 3]|nr:MAG: hypothetical protein DRR00_23035 [Gammaproteobacteria bacterium]RKZ68422.1 MAG: hypothetical protein DRQ99_03850 [Gammaproteobacteria bacterium]RKZ86351.1 MAG: hypothetical protein DRR16_09900 [Gammaproteobacteria bacterium]
MYEEWVAINPVQNFQVAPVSPIFGTPLSKNLRQAGLLRFDEPSLYGRIWTTSVDSLHPIYMEIYAWQKRLTQIGRSRYMEEGPAIGYLTTN